MERSIAFYHQLGLTLASVYKYKGRAVWAALESDRAELMVSTDGDAVDPTRQGVLFYLYSPDLTTLREQLLAAGIEPGEIEDGAPGTTQEMWPHRPRWVRADGRADRLVGRPVHVVDTGGERAVTWGHLTGAALRCRSARIAAVVGTFMDSCIGLPPTVSPRALTPLHTPGDSEVDRSGQPDRARLGRRATASVRHNKQR